MDRIQDVRYARLDAAESWCRWLSGEAYLATSPTGVTADP
jgi:hypothetical protein